MTDLSAVRFTPVEGSSNSLVVTPHPITLQDQRIYHAGALLPGEKLTTFLARYGVRTGEQWVVSIGGVEVQEAHWHLVTPKHRHLIEARRVPEKNVLQLVAVAALAYFTFGAGGIAGGSFLGLSGAGGWIAAGAAYLGGSMVINKLLGPKPIAAKPPAALANNTSSPSYSLQAGKNRARQFETMGLVLGQPYCLPDLAAQPYTFFANGEQYLWQVFHFGLNCASVDALRIGQTALSYYPGVRVLRDGFDADNTGLPLLTTNVDTVAGGILVGGGAAVVRTSSTETIVLAIDLECSLYQVDPSTGAYISNSVAVRIQYRKIGDVTWVPFPLDENPDVVLENASSKTLRLTYQRTVSAGQYEVRLQKLYADQDGGRLVNTMQWQSLKSFQLDNGNYKGQARLALQIQATGQLNGAIDELNGICTAKPMPFWNGNEWVTASDRSNGLSNPGALMLLLYRGIYDEEGRLIAGMGAPDDEIDVEGLQGFMEFCTAHRFTFDLFLQENTSIGDLIESIAAAGLGSRSEHTGKLGVIWFSDDQPVEAVLNMTTIKAKSFSVEYNTQETADELDFQYFDRQRNYTWKSVRVKAPGVITPQRTSRQQLQGVTEEGHAAILARFSMGQNSFHRKTVNCETDLEHMTFRRGTVMAVSHDLTQWGYGGRVQSAVDNGGFLTLTLDDIVPATSPTGAVTRYLGLRIPGEGQFRIFPVDAFTGSTRTVTLATDWPGGVAVPGDSAGNPAHDTVWIYDFKPTPGQKLRVSDVIPQGNMDGAKVQMVPESAEFWDYVWNGEYTPPINTSLLSQSAPVVTRTVVTEQLARQGNNFYTELTLTFDVTGSFEGAELWGATDNGFLQRLGVTNSQSISWRGGIQEVWTLQLRPYSSTRVGAPYGLTYTVLGLSVPPPNITDLGIAGAVLNWTEVKAVDVLGYVFRCHYGNNLDWGTAAPLHTGHITASPFFLDTRPGGLVTIMGKAVDTSGNESNTAAVVVINLGDAPVANVVEVFDLKVEGFPGAITGGSVIAGDLVATATNSFYGPGLQSFYGQGGESFYQAASFGQIGYVSRQIAVVSALAGSVMTLLLDTLGVDLTVEYRLSGPAPFYAGETTPFYGSGADSFYGPPGVWVPWPGQIVVANDVYEFRITLGAGAIQAQILTLALVIDAPDIVEYVEDFELAIGGTVPPYVSAFTVIKTVTPSLQAQISGATSIHLNKTNNLAPVLTAINGVTPVAGASADCILKGY